MAAQALQDILLTRADSDPGRVAYETLSPAGEVAVLTYAQVAARATALAADLARQGTGPVLLAYPAGLDYPVAVFASFLAGRPVVPAYPPGSSTPDNTRLRGIVADAQPSAVIAPVPHSDLAAVPATFAVPGAEANTMPWGRPAVAGTPEAAIIQYTSGSTGRPRGVLVRHGSLAANTAAIARTFRLHSGSRALTWLPPFHDMGLVGCLLTPVAVGIPVRILSPGDFLKSPLSWLRQITESGATASGAPNFAYELCVRRVRSLSDLEGLDLSRWEVAFNGGETVRARTLAAFAETFGPAGFREPAFLPCYGLAEATLMVSAGRWNGRTGGTDSAVSCGMPVPGQRVAIVDPERLTLTGGEGEIWISGPHITSGYFAGSPEGLFGELDEVRYLRTGDLGRWRNGELILTGRVKDVIVFRGANYHAVDVETVALETAGRAGRMAAAFLVESGPDPMPVLVLEVSGRPDEAFAARVGAAVLARTGLRLARVVLARPRSVPRTSSGKVRRWACRDAFIAGAFDDAVASGGPGPTTRDAAVAELRGLIGGIAAGVCDLDDYLPDATLADLGMDSVRAAEAAAVLEHALGLAVPLDAVLGAATPQEIASALVASWADAGVAAGQVIERVLMVGTGTEDR